MKKFILIIISLFSIIYSSFSQKFEWETVINNVDSSSYYDIFIRPEITAKLNYKFSDIRIYDKNDNEVPFLRRSDINSNKITENNLLQIIENQNKISKKYTSAIIHNTNFDQISSFILIIQNTKAEIWLHISASNDNKTWTVLKNNSRYQSEYSDSATAEVHITDIPTSKYNYYKFLIYNYNTEVIVLNKVYNYIISNIEKKFSEVLKPTFIQNDTLEHGKSIVNISFSEEQYIDKLMFEINNPRYYLRKAELTKQDSVSGRKIKLDFYDQRQQDFYLSSDSLNILHLSKYKAKDLFLVIDNNDNLPLIISDITAYQENEYFVAFLEKGQKYKIRFGNKAVAAPIYDIKFFKDRIPDQLPIIELPEVKRIYDPKSDKNHNIYIEPGYLWLAFAAVVLILGVISYVIFRKTNIEKEE